MRITLAVLLLCAAGPANGADFRGLEFGSACVGIADREKGLGSRVESLKAIDDGFIGIHTEHLGRDAEVKYFCDSGRLSAGMYVYEFGTYEEAAAYFVTIRPTLLAEFGSPHLDSMAMLQADAPELIRYSLSWAYDTHLVQVVVMRRVTDQPESEVIIRYKAKT